MPALKPYKRPPPTFVKRIGSGSFDSGYTIEKVLALCEMVSDGKTLGSILQEHGPSRVTFYRWLAENVEAGRAYAAARELSAHKLEEDALDMARELKSGTIKGDLIRAYDVAMYQLRWSAGKRNPRVYSDKVMPSLTMGIQINTSLDLGVDREAGGAYTIEATVQPEEHDPRHPNTQAMLDGEREAPRTIGAKSGAAKPSSKRVGKVERPASSNKGAQS